ncbi:unnamed protein product [Cladocopium goreaui]|uniref:Ubiquitin-like domain-containing protein n=1 Tax=Cladocopium goreaui TaxID=2562237 RepID=A0A9P1G916_9DINO|nr:unnamed protein product [Cladocopium goreaui]
MSSIEVHNLSGPLCTVTLESNSTVADLKVALAKVLRVPRRQQRLISGSSPLEDCQRLEELGEPRVTFVRITYSAATLEWMALVRRKSAFLSNAPLEVRNDHEVVLTAMQHDRDAICWAAEQILNDRDFAFAVAARHGQALQHLTSWQGDPSIVLAAVSQDPSAIEFASQSLVSQQDFLIDAIQCSKGHVLQHLSPEVQEEVALQKAAVSCNWLMLEHLAQKMPDIRDDREVVFHAVATHGCALEFASVALRRDAELVLLALQRSRGAALRWADETLKGRRDLVCVALQEDAANLQYASEELRADPELVLEAVKRNGNCLKFASPRVLSAALLQTAVDQAGGHVLEAVPSEFLELCGMHMEAVDIFEAT